MRPPDRPLSGMPILIEKARREKQEALAIARTLGDRSIEVVATYYLGDTHNIRGEYSEAAKLFERNIRLLDGKLRSERLGAAIIQAAGSVVQLALTLSHLGRFDEAIGHGEAGEACRCNSHRQRRPSIRRCPPTNLDL
jgi:tetratricopeptide (TPR) repeat protein